jgi:steroid 5-alpha reductase family enzyme
VTIETLSDIQLTKFRAIAQPGDLLTDGWWSRTRHPNYFGDALFWWGIWAAAVATTPEVIWTIYAPALMTFLLIRISGAEMLERRLIKKPGYAEYMARTNRFVPRVFQKRA